MIRNAIESDLLEIKSIVAKARELMKASGNVNQWVDGYPSSDSCYDRWFTRFLRL